MHNKIPVLKKIEKIKRKKKLRLENTPLSKSLEFHIENISKSLVKQIDKEILKRKYAPVSAVLKLVGAGAFLAASFAAPNLPLVLKPFLSNKQDYPVWKRFNIPYLKRTLERLEKQKLVEIEEKDNLQIVKITNAGRNRILKYALDELTLEKPKYWDGKWYLISYDIPGKMQKLRNIFREYLLLWQFFPLHESVFLHAYPCGKEIDFLREYLGIGKYIRIFRVTKIENDKLFRTFFGI